MAGPNYLPDSLLEDAADDRYQNEKQSVLGDALASMQSLMPKPVMPTMPDPVSRFAESVDGLVGQYAQKYRPQTADQFNNSVDSMTQGYEEKYGPALTTMGGTPEAEQITQPGGNAYVQPGTAAPTGAPTQGRAPVAPDAPVTKETVTQAAATALERAGLPANMAPYIAGIAINEGILSPGTIARDSWSVGGVKAPGSAGVVTVPTREVVNGQSVMQTASFGKFNSMQEGMDALATFVRDSPRFGPVAQQAAQSGDYSGMIEGFRQKGYATDPNWTRQVNSIASGLSVPESAPASPMPAAGQSTSQQFASGESLTPDQFNSGLSTADAYAACGVVAAVAFARKNGRNPTVQEATNLAKQYGWSSEQGMGRGTAGTVDTANALGAAVKAGPVDDRRMAEDVQRGNPVGINLGGGPGNNGHFMVAERYDSSSGKFDFGNSAKALKASGGNTWYTLAELPKLGFGSPRDAIYADAPDSPAPSVVAGKSDNTVKGMSVEQAMATDGNTRAQLDMNGGDDGTAGPTVYGDAGVSGRDDAGVQQRDGGYIQPSPPARDIRGDYAPRAVEPGDYQLPVQRADQQSSEVSAENDGAGLHPLETALPPQSPGGAVEPDVSQAPASSGNPIVDGFNSLADGLRNLGNLIGGANKTAVDAANAGGRELAPQSQGQDLGEAFTGASQLPRKVRDLAEEHLTPGLTPKGNEEFWVTDQKRANELFKKQIDHTITPAEEDELTTLQMKQGSIIGSDAPTIKRGSTGPRGETSVFGVPEQAPERANLPNSPNSPGIISGAQADDALPQIRSEKPVINGSKIGQELEIPQEAPRDTGGRPQGIEPLVKAGARAVGSGVGAGYQESQQEGSTPGSVLRAGLEGAATSVAGDVGRSRLTRKATGNLVARAVRATDEMRQSGSPELTKLADMMDEPAPKTPNGRPIASALERQRQIIVKKLTDSNVTMDEIQKDVAKATNGQLNVEDRVSAIQRLNPDSATDMQIQDEIMGPLRELGKDRPHVSAIMTLKQNMDQAAAMGQKAASEYVSQGRVNAEKEVARLQGLVNKANAPMSTPGDLAKAQARLATEQQAEVAAAQQIGQTTRDTRAFSGSLNAAESQKALDDLKQTLGPQKFAEMEKAADDLFAFNQGTRDIAVNAHLWSPKLATSLSQTYPHYSPTNIIKYLSIDGPGGVPVGKTVGLNDVGLKTLSEEGTKVAKQDPIEASVAARYDMMRRAKRNMVTEKFLDTARADPDLSQHVTEIISRKQWQKQGRKLQAGQMLDVERLTPDQARIGWFDKNAVKHEYLVDDWAKPLIEGSSLGEMNAYQKFLQEWRSAVTDRSLSFTERNAPRDAWTTFNTMLTKQGGPTVGNAKKVVELMAESYRDAFKGVRDGTFHGTIKDYLSAGGGFARASGRGLEEQTKTVDDIARTGGIKISNPTDLYKWATDPLSEMNKRLELGPRGAMFKQDKLAGGSDTSAVIAARDLMPYEVSGDLMKALNRTVPFLTARIAGTMSQARLAAKYPKSYLPTALATTVAPAVAITMYNRMDEDRSKAYDDVPDYLKYLGQVVMMPWAGKDVYGQKLPNYLFLPTGPVSPFSIMGHMVGDAIMGKGAKPNDYAEMFDAITQSMSPVDTAAGSALSQAAGPIGSTAIGLVTGKDPFRGSEVATTMNDLDATRASQGIAAGANAALSKIPVVGPAAANVRPSQIEYAARNLTGGPGAQVLAASDLGRQRAGESSNIQDIPGIGGLVSPLIGNRTGGLMVREADRTMASEAGKAMYDAGVGWRPPRVDDHIGKVGITRSERGEVQRDANTIFNENVVNVRQWVPDWDSYDKAGKEQVFKNLYANARLTAEQQLMARYADRFKVPEQVHRVEIEQQRKAG